MNNLDSFERRMLTNILFGSGILLIILLLLFFGYLINKQSNLNMDELNEIVEKEAIQNHLRDCRCEAIHSK